MLPQTEKEQTFVDFFGDAEQRLRRAFTATFGSDVGRELCAEALAYGWENWDRLSTMDNPAGYLYRVGVSKGRRLTQSARLNYEPVAADSPRRFEPGLAAALSDLPETQRVVVSLVHGYGWSLADVAELLGVAKSTIQSYEGRAMKRLRRKLGVAR